jgi:putative methanogenesis marker protein 8
MKKDRHVMEVLGLSRVVVENGVVVDVSEPRVEFCPLFFKHRGIEKLTKESIRENVEFRIKDFGIFTERRQMRMKDFLSFGISELMSMCVSKGILDCSVCVCDGSGTAVVEDPELIQGIGGRISGMVETSPLQTVMDAIGRDRVLDPETARIDQVAGARKAWEMGYRKIGVTVVRGNDAALLKKEFGEHVVLFAVHTSGVTEEDAMTLYENCDIATACASKHMWDIGKRLGAEQIGTKVPVFAITDLGKEICAIRLKQISKEARSGPDDPARPLI